jgi:hypothetical protein
MRVHGLVAAGCVAALGLFACSSTPGGSGAIPTRAPASPAEDTGTLAGFAFVDSSVTSKGSKATLPAGTKIYPPGSTVTGSNGCPTTRYQTDGLMVVVIDYAGRPTAASVQVTRHPANGGDFQNAPYYLDLNAGRTIQFLGPIFDNGKYDVHFSYHYNLGQEKSADASIVLARSCPPGQ